MHFVGALNKQTIIFEDQLFLFSAIRRKQGSVGFSLPSHNKGMPGERRKNATDLVKMNECDFDRTTRVHFRSVVQHAHGPL
jgi:hypothetical protein